MRAMSFMVEFAQVAVEQRVHRVPRIAVQIDEGTEVFLFALKEPVDGALFVGLKVVRLCASNPRMPPRSVVFAD
jgi:hypothetical protein